jgi:uncharacterized membrane protein
MSGSTSLPPSPQDGQSSPPASLLPALNPDTETVFGLTPKELKEIPPDILTKIRNSPVRTISLRSEHTHTEVSLSRSAPLPLPSELAAYNDIIPQGADRIMKMAEAQTSHRLAIETTVISSQQSQESRGQFLGFVIAIVGLICGTYTAVMGQPLAGAAIGGVPLVSLVSVFVYSKHKDNAELSEKKKQMEAVKPEPSPDTQPDRKKKKKQKNR